MQLKAEAYPLFLLPKQIVVVGGGGGARVVEVHDVKEEENLL